jgi:hypothetical protein
MLKRALQAAVAKGYLDLSFISGEYLGFEDQKVEHL